MKNFIKICCLETEEQKKWVEKKIASNVVVAFVTL
jgi:hypothetical protein